MHYKLHQKLLGYFLDINQLFHKGDIFFSLNEDNVQVFYHLHGKNCISFSIPITTEKQTFSNVQDYCISCYYDGERDKKPMDIKAISLLLGVTYNNAKGIIHRIYNKIRTHGEHTIS